MRIMVVFAHPLDDSFNAALHRTVVNALRECGHHVDDCDLYAEGFNPVLGAEERRHYHDETRNRAAVAGYVERLLEAEALVLCHPTWCFGLPAILKGFLDRVLMPGVSFHLAGWQGFAGVDPYPPPRRRGHLRTAALYGSVDGRPAAPHPDAIPVLADREARHADLSGEISHEHGARG